MQRHNGPSEGHTPPPLPARYLESYSLLHSQCFRGPAAQCGDPRVGPTFRALMGTQTNRAFTMQVLGPRWGWAAGVCSRAAWGQVEGHSVAQTPPPPVFFSFHHFSRPAVSSITSMGGLNRLCRARNFLKLSSLKHLKILFTQFTFKFTANIIQGLITKINVLLFLPLILLS